MVYNEKGVELFMKITSDINKHNREDASRLEKLFAAKKPYITYVLIAINVLCYFFAVMSGNYVGIINKFSIVGSKIRDGEYFRLFSGIFLHLGVLHLTLNSSFYLKFFYSTSSYS